MKIRALVIGAVVSVGGFAGCLGSDGSSKVDSQLSYDFASSSDRAKFAANDLQYQGTVGPYAVYRVTGPHPSLVGPHVAMPSSGGVSVIMGAKNYFVAQQNAPMAMLHLTLDGQAACGMPSAPQGDGSCTSGSQGSSDSSDVDGGAPPVFVPPDGGNGGWGSGCHSGGGSGGGGGWGGGGGGGYGGGGGGGGGGYGGGGGGGGYSNPGGYGGGGWNNNGCGDGGTSGGSMGGANGDGGAGGSSGGSSGGMNGGGGGGMNGGGGGGMNGGGGGGMNGGGGAGGSGGDSSSDGGPLVGVSFQSPPPVGSTVLLRQVIVAGPSVRAATPAPGICCSKGQCTLSSSGTIQ